MNAYQRLKQRRHLVIRESMNFLDKSSGTILFSNAYIIMKLKRIFHRQNIILNFGNDISCKCISTYAMFLHTILSLTSINANSFRIYYREPINSVIYGKRKNRDV